MLLPTKSFLLILPDSDHENSPKSTDGDMLRGDPPNMGLFSESQKKLPTRGGLVVAIGPDCGICEPDDRVYYRLDDAIYVYYQGQYYAIVDSHDIICKEIPDSKTIKSKD